MNKKTVSVKFQSEPAPKRIKPPTEEPVIRIGVITEEDNKSLVFFSPLTETKASISGTNQEILLKASAPYCLSISNGKAVLSLNEVPIHAIEGSLIITPTDMKLSPKLGTLVKGIVAGRGFHWQKEIEQTLPGTIVFHVVKDRWVVVNHIGMEDYVTCVVASEMSGESPAEQARAQATAARSWAWVFLENKYPGRLYMLCNDDLSQRYQGSTFLTPSLIEAVKESSGMYLLVEDGTVCPSYYSKSCGGVGDESENVFGFATPGLKSYQDSQDPIHLDLTKENDFRSWLEAAGWQGKTVFCSPEVLPEETINKYLGAVDTTQQYFRWEHITKAETVIRKLRERYGLTQANSLLDLEILERSVSGRITKLSVTFTDNSGALNRVILPNQFEIRATLHNSFLYSSAFIFDLKKTTDGKSIEELHFQGAGWGHGVGLCQIGTVGMALKGYNFKQILKHYFPNTTLRQVY